MSDAEIDAHHLLSALAEAAENRPTPAHVEKADRYRRQLAKHLTGPEGARLARIIGNYFDALPGVAAVILRAEVEKIILPIIRPIVHQTPKNSK